MTHKIKLAPAMAVLLIGGITLGGCSSIRDTLGVNKYPPDEFAVVAKTPLIIPPEYNLRPPGVGNPHPREVDTSELAMRALFPDVDGQGSSLSETEKQLLQASSAGGSGAEARSNLSPMDEVVGKGSFTEEILYDDTTSGGSIELRDAVPADPND